MDQLQAILEKFKLWQISLVLSILLLTLGYTGEIRIFDKHILEGYEEYAIWGGLIFFILAAILRYIPKPPDNG